MPTYTVHDAKTNLSKLIEQAEAGEEVIIARRDQPAVRLVPIKARTPKRQFGAYKGQATLTDAFFEPLPDEELSAWEGETQKPLRPSKRPERSKS
jgi:prevent-host-death family protein